VSTDVGSNGGVIPPLYQRKGVEHPVAGLSCPEDPNQSRSQAYWNMVAQDEIVYWRDVPQDSSRISPFRADRHISNETKKYLTFEPDEGKRLSVIKESADILVDPNDSIVTLQIYFAGGW
jgi:hypothetical protein